MIKKSLAVLYAGFLIIFISTTYCSAADPAEKIKKQAQKYYWGKSVKQDLSKALSLYEKAAGLGDAEAQFIAGGMYYTGKGTDINYPKAFNYLASAADQGKSSPEAQFALAEMYLKGEIVPRNLILARKFFNQAAEGGAKDAQNELGFMYYVGNGVEKDFNKSLDWFEKAAAQGMVIAQYNVGMMWYLGNSDRGADLVKAYAWLGLAAAGGHPNAAGVQNHIEPLLTPEELKQSQNLSTALYNSINKKPSQGK